MRVVTFIIVAFVFAAVYVYVRYKGKTPEVKTAAGASLSLPEYDEYIRILAFNPKEYKNAYEFGRVMEEGIESLISEYQIKNCKCRVEFTTVGLCLVAVIRIKTMPGKRRKVFELGRNNG